MSTIRTLLVSVSVLAIASVASAQCSKESATAKADGAKAGCCASKATLASDQKTCTKAQLASDSKGCSAAQKAECAAKGLVCDDATLACLPKMKYRVGDKTVCCPKEAAKLAAAASKDAAVTAESAGTNGHCASTRVQYVVGDETYTDEAEAKKAYAKALESFIAEATTVKYAVGEEAIACPMTAKSLAEKEGKPMHYRLASFEFDCPEKAEAAAKAARAAAEKVAMKMVVGDKEYHCAVSAAEVAKKDGKKVEYCVGDSKLTCPIDADVELAREKAIAALQALAAAAQG